MLTISVLFLSSWIASSFSLKAFPSLYDVQFIVDVTIRVDFNIRNRFLLTFINQINLDRLVYFIY